MEGMEDTSTRISPTQEVSGQVYWVLQDGDTNLWLSQNIPVANSKTGQVYWGPRGWLGEPEGIRGDNSEEKTGMEVTKSLSQKTWQKILLLPVHFKSHHRHWHRLEKKSPVKKERGRKGDISKCSWELLLMKME